MTPQQTIEHIKALPLKNYPYEELHFFISLLGNVGLVAMTLHKGKKIVRGRINEGKVFENLIDLSYRPQAINKRYYRASTPNRTMFYGAFVPENAGKKEPQTGRITVAFELSEFVRSDDSQGSMVITYSSWEVLHDISLAAIVYYNDFVSKTNLATELNRSYQEFIKKQGQAAANNSMLVTDYFAKEFSKQKIASDSDYCISAVFSEAMVDRGFDGVLYPSVRMEGFGFNVALSPNCVDNKLRLIGAGDCTIYKNKKEICIGNDTVAMYEPGKKLTYQEAPPGILVTKEQGFNKVGL